MADIICRWRNGTPKTVVELVNSLPHDKMSNEEFRIFMQHSQWGSEFFHTPYQLACQLGLYCEAEDGFYYPRFDHDISESEAQEYLEYWMPRYYVPNPYVGRNGFNGITCPTYVLFELYNYAIHHANCTYKEAYETIFQEKPTNNNDIVKNYINNYSKVLHFDANGCLIVTKEDPITIFNFMDRSSKKDFFDNFSRNNEHKNINFPLQQIFYGAPGTGKSHKVKEVTETLPKSDVFRTTFHPDSDYSTFVGCYKPKMVKAPIRDGSGHEITSACEDEKKRIAYEYEPQAFLKAYVRAYETSEPVFLVIEEINRGNCAQIFGDMFQLLDRNESGESDYAIKPETAIQEFLNEKLEDCDIADEAIKSGEEMRLPFNLHIWATMNTSDQSLFPIDSAFKRRWDWKYVPIDTRKESWSIKVNGTEYSWSSFLEKINAEIDVVTHSEDKKLGLYFCKAENGVISAERFVSKVLFYIWNDVFKDYGFEKDIFNDTDGKLSFGKFYQENGDIQEDKVALFLKNLVVEITGAAEDETDIEYDTTDASKAEHKETLVAVTINGERLTADGMTQFDLYLNTIKKIGVDKVGPVLETMKYRRKGSPMATKDQVQSLLESDGYSYVEADGYYFVKGSNGYTLIRILEDLKRELNIDMEIEYR